MKSLFERWHHRIQGIAGAFGLLLLLFMPLAVFWWLHGVTSGHPMTLADPTECSVQDGRMIIADSSHSDALSALSDSDGMLPCRERLRRALYTGDHRVPCYQIVNMNGQRTLSASPTTVISLWTLILFSSVIASWLLYYFFHSWRKGALWNCWHAGQRQPLDQKAKWSLILFAPLVLVVTWLVTLIGDDVSMVRSRSWSLAQCKIIELCQPEKERSSPQIVYEREEDGVRYRSNSVNGFEYGGGYRQSRAVGEVLSCWYDPSFPAHMKIQEPYKISPFPYVMVFGSGALIATFFWLIVRWEERRRSAVKNTNPD